MDRKATVSVFFVVMAIVSGYAWGNLPAPLSPGEMIGQNCPAFNWSASDHASAYRLEVYEQMATDAPTQEQMQETAIPVIRKEIAAPAHSWTPSAGECLARGAKYVWYVQGVNAQGTGSWSEGMGFQVEASGAVVPMTVVEGPSNTFVGTNAGISTTGNLSNTFIGAEAGRNTTSGWANTFVGYVAGNANIGAHNNTFMGQAAGWKNTTGNDNTYIGNGAGLYYDTASNNTFVGSGAGTSSSGVINPSGSNNSFFGAAAGNANNSGDDNVFIGNKAGFSNDQGSYNTYVGTEAGYSNTGLHYDNVYVGYRAGYSNSEGAANVFIGALAGYSNTGNHNVFIGRNAGRDETGSSKLYIANNQTATPLVYGEFGNNKLTVNGNLEVIGPDNGLVRLSNVTTDNTTKVSRMVLRHYSNAQSPVYLFGAASTSSSNFVAFGGGSPIGNAATQIDLFTAPNTTTSVGTPRLTITGNGNVGIGTQTPSAPLQMAGGAYTNGSGWFNASSREYKDNIESLSTEEAFETLRELNPVKFAYKSDRSEKHVGFIAEDVPDLIAAKDRKGLNPMDIVAVLTKVVQELKAENEGLKAKNESLEKRLLAIEGKMTTSK